MSTLVMAPSFMLLSCREQACLRLNSRPESVKSLKGHGWVTCLACYPLTLKIKFSRLATEAKRKASHFLYRWYRKTLACWLLTLKRKVSMSATNARKRAVVYWRRMPRGTLLTCENCLQDDNLGWVLKLRDCTKNTDSVCKFQPQLPCNSI